MYNAFHTLVRISCFLLFILISCTSQKQSTQSQQQSTPLSQLINDSALLNAHIGISIYDPSTGKYLYDHNANKYFVPASNTKIPTCYAAMKYLGDSLITARINVKDSEIIIHPTGDPTVLHEDFSYQPLFEKMKGYKSIVLDWTGWKEEPWGSGWSWNDYDQYYMAERSPMPVYGNIVKFWMAGDTLKSIPLIDFYLSSPDSIYKKRPGLTKVFNPLFRIKRPIGQIAFDTERSTTEFKSEEIPFSTNPLMICTFLRNTLEADSVKHIESGAPDISNSTILHSQPVDSMLKPMMHRSDNFFAEQSLLMVSNERLGIMSDEQIIDTLLKTDFKDLPQRPRWTDGSGLSRYNLFSPLNFITILNKMKQEFGMDRIKVIFPSGGEGTLSNYYKSDTSYIYAKTGTLSGVVALSGFIYTKKNKLLIFSILVNNHTGSATPVRRAVERFLSTVRNDE